MNPNWKNFLQSYNATFLSETEISFPPNTDSVAKSIYPVSQFAILAVTGSDAATFLQGQITCDIYTVTESQGCLSAFCSAKGRTISTFLIIKKSTVYFLILPVELLETVKNKLQMYILRSDVTLLDNRQKLCLIGLCCSEAELSFPQQSLAVTHQVTTIIKYPSPQHRYLVLADADQAMSFWTESVREKNFNPVSSNQWTYLDIEDGIPWLSRQTTEEFIPQMINLDQLGGISFKKGCYTGQEIVARTHYLGKAKRQMYLAECDLSDAPAPNSAILDDKQLTEQNIGKVLMAACQHNICKMLVVIQASEAANHSLRLDNRNQDKIRISQLPR